MSRSSRPPAKPALTPSLGMPTGVPMGRYARPAKLHDCGTFGQLTTKDIARIAGISDCAARNRVQAGWTGDMLCQRRGSWPMRRKGVVNNPTVLKALRIALVFANHPPTTPEQLQAVVPMARDNALRWLRAYQAALKQGGRK